MGATKRFYEELELQLSVKDFHYDDITYMHELHNMAQVRYKEIREASYSAMLEDLSHGI